MEKELAEHVVRTSFQTMSELAAMLPHLKQHCSDEEADPYRKAIGRACGYISTDLLKTVFAAHPDLEKQFGQTIERYGKAI